jgi:hypothetical protein
VGFNSPLMRWVIDHVSRRPDLIDRPSRVFDRTLPPDEIVPMPTMLKWMGEALFRGRFDVLAGFMAMGKTQSAEKREMQARMALLEQAKSALANAREGRRTPDSALAGRPAIHRPSPDLGGKMYTASERAFH